MRYVIVALALCVTFLPAHAKPQSPNYKAIAKARKKNMKRIKAHKVKRPRAPKHVN